MTRPHRPGAVQRGLLRALQSGRCLYLESGIWYHDEYGVDRTTVSGVSCRGLLEYGYICLDEEQRHPFWRGGVRWRYMLTELGKRETR